MDVDDYYMTHVYLSELWLWQHMKNHIDVSMSARWQKQLNDEKRHAAMTRGALNKSLAAKGLHLAHNDMRFSIEKCMYQDLGGINVDSISTEEFPAFVFVVERRATLLFKYYLRFGTNPYYTKVTRKLIEDEVDHLDLHKEAARQSPHYERFQRVDRMIYDRLSHVYSTGGPFFNNMSFWQDMFSNKLVETASVIY